MLIYWNYASYTRLQIKSYKRIIYCLRENSDVAIRPVRQRKNRPPLSKSCKISCFCTESRFWPHNKLNNNTLHPHEFRTNWFCTVFVWNRTILDDFCTGITHWILTHINAAVRKHEIFPIFLKVSFIKMIKNKIYNIRHCHTCTYIVWRLSAQFFIFC